MKRFVEQDWLRNEEVATLPKPQPGQLPGHQQRMLDSCRPVQRRLWYLALALVLQVECLAYRRSWELFRWMPYLSLFSQKLSTKQIFSFSPIAVGVQLFTYGHMPAGEGFVPVLWVPLSHPNSGSRKARLLSISLEIRKKKYCRSREKKAKEIPRDQKKKMTSESR